MFVTLVQTRSPGRLLLSLCHTLALPSSDVQLSCWHRTRHKRFCTDKLQRLSLMKLLLNGLPSQISQHCGVTLTRDRRKRNPCTLAWGAMIQT